jgi:hypothetical protein
MKVNYNFVILILVLGLAFYMLNIKEHLTDSKKSTPKTTPTKTTPAKTTPAKTTPAKTTPAKTTPAKTTPAKTTPAKTTPAKTTPAKTKTVASLESFQYGVNKDYSGNDIKNYDDVATDEDCAKKCLNEKTCNVFVRPTTGKGCWIKTKAENASKSSDRITFAKKTYKLPPPSFKNYFCTIDQVKTAYKSSVFKPRQPEHMICTTTKDAKGVDKTVCENRTYNDDEIKQKFKVTDVPENCILELVKTWNW